MAHSVLCDLGMLVSHFPRECCCYLPAFFALMFSKMGTNTMRLSFRCIGGVDGVSRAPSKICHCQTFRCLDVNINSDGWWRCFFWQSMRHVLVLSCRRPDHIVMTKYYRLQSYNSTTVVHTHYFAVIYLCLTSEHDNQVSNGIPLLFEGAWPEVSCPAVGLLRH